MNEIFAHMQQNNIERLPPSPLILDGQIHRFKTNNSGIDGWYCGVSIKNGQIEYIKCSYGDWSKNITETYSSHADYMTPPHIKIEYDKLLKKQEYERETLRMEAIQKMSSLWWDAHEAQPTHPYLVKKKIKPIAEIKQIKDILLIPVYDENHILTSIQRIYPNGDKRFLKNLPIKFGYFMLREGEEFSNTIYVTESFANACSLYMATKNTVFCSFSAQALCKVVSWLNKKYIDIKIIIVADNDGENGIGQKYAKDAAFYNDNVAVVVPELEGYKKCDISDVFVKKGIEEVQKQLKEYSISCRKVVNDNSPATSPIDLNPLIIPVKELGIISDIIEYYNSTSIQNQPGFALQTALAFCSVILGRKFKTDFNHYPSLYFLNIGKSGSGKEHQKTVINTLLNYVNKENLLGASGYTSPGAINTALMKAPAHISLIDEFGDYLISLNDKNNQQRLVNKCLLEIFGACNGVYIGEQYSKFSRSKDEEDKVIIKNPALTILGAVQPNKFYSNIHSGLITDGFLGRFIIYESLEPKQSIHLDKPTENNFDYLLDNIKSWVDIVYKRLYGVSDFIVDPGYAISPNIKVIRLSDDAKHIFNTHMDRLSVDIEPKLEPHNAEELIVRWPYMIGCLSLIISLSKDPWTDIVYDKDMRNAIDIIERSGIYFIENIIDKINTTKYEKDKNEFLEAIRKYGSKGITSSDICRKKPFYRFPRRDRYAILEDLLESELIIIKETPTARKNIVTYYINENQ